MGGESKNEVIDSAQLAEITRAALPYLGPYSITTVKRFSKTTNSTTELCELVAVKIKEVHQREAFLRSATRLLETLSQRELPVLTVTAQESNTGERPASMLTAELIERGQAALAEIIGPLAGVLASRYSKKAENSRVFFNLLSGHLRDATEREKFFSAVRDLNK
ncbi:MAG: hypothetical protein ABL860_07495 [Candidatus Nitrotoga sp.]